MYTVLWLKDLIDKIVRECEVNWEKQRVRARTLQDEGGPNRISTTDYGNT